MEKFISTSNKKGQAWSIDLIVAGVLFLAGIIILFYYAINQSSQTRNQLDELFYEGKLASELILSDESFGILTDNVVNQTKLENFFYLADDMKKEVLGLRHNFYFSMENLEINGNHQAYVGIVNTSDVENSIQITRLTVYKNKPTKFQLYVWS